MNGTNNNTFAGCTIVATEKLENFTRDGINAKIISLGATPGSSVTKKTDYLICGEKAGSKLAKAPIHEDDVSAVLWQRWVACYMLYDWNLRHADNAYLSNKYTWVQKVCKRLEGAAIDAASLKNTLTDTFNQILLEDVEDFIRKHMKVWECDRLTVELFKAAPTL